MQMYPAFDTLIQAFWWFISTSQWRGGLGGFRLAKNTKKNWLLYMGLEPEVPETSLPISRSFHTLTWGVGFFIIRHRYVLYYVIGAHRMLGEYLMSFWFPLRLAMCSLCWATAHFSNTLILIRVTCRNSMWKEIVQTLDKIFSTLKYPVTCI